MSDKKYTDFHVFITGAITLLLIFLIVLASSSTPTSTPNTRNSEEHDSKEKRK